MATMKRNRPKTNPRGRARAGKPREVRPEIPYYTPIGQTDNESETEPRIDPSPQSSIPEGEAY